ncbi:hypothetical protein HALLA_05970 [Halostagnicola larsenii XH-48]|uniref:DUF7311 domain-containing protein n=1 Tax=Halostagnicola larsenii XH-48 TaxID=797299 RepID=W0JIB1_9EURY|nr:hypothetical protein [Halostagnicola larsenii]AHF98460.1 hypothetical protein HALLA_05970 [Halostagnicola larsenii XH-48]
MIRYVLAVLLTVGLLALSIPAVNLAGEIQTERQLETEVTDLETAAVSLFETEEVSHDGAPAPRRAVTLEFPESSMTTVPVDSFEVERIHDDTSVVSYAAEGRNERQQSIAAPIVSEDPTRNESVDLGSGSGERTVVLRLEADSDGDPVVTVDQA